VVIDLKKKYEAMGDEELAENLLRELGNLDPTESMKAKVIGYVSNIPLQNSKETEEIDSQYETF